MISGRDIVVLSNVDWVPLWQANQELASRLARAGNRVLYVENLGVRSPGPVDARRVLSRLRRWARSVRTGSTRGVAPGLYVCSPLVLPPFGPRLRRALNRGIFIPAIRRAAARLGMRDPLLWTYLPTDAAVDLIGQLRTPSSVVVYMCLADFEELASDRDRLVRAERGLVASSDLVLARGPSLTARCARWSDRVHQIDLGVALDAFPMPAGRDRGGGDDAGASVHPTPLGGLPRPVIGYVGAIHRHLDLRLAVALAAARPDWSWVYVGPPQVPIGQLAARSNVHLTGAVPHHSLARYIGSFDVGIVPYRLGSATDTVLPTKVLEYLAMGKPVVSTELPEVRRFDSRHGAVVTAASETEDFIRAIENALATDSGERRAARRRAVAPLDWGAQLERLSALIESSVSDVASMAQPEPGHER